MSEILLEAAVVALFVVLASGYGALVPRSWRFDDVPRAVAADFLIGILVCAAVFGMAIQIGISFAVALAGTGVFVGIGGLGILRATLQARATLLARAGVGLLIAAYWLIGGAIRGNDGARDPWYYAAIPFLSFRHEWLAGNARQLPYFSEIQASLSASETSRAAASTLLWPLAALGRGLGVAQVTEAAIGLLLVMVWIVADLVRREPVSRWAALAIGLGGAGIYNVIAALSGGQMQQPFILTIMLGCVWLATTTIRPFAHPWVFALGGYVVSSSYPESLVTSPLYVLAAAMGLGKTYLWTAAQLGGLAAGWALEQLVTGGYALRYLLWQSGTAIGWSPVPITPSSPAEIIVDLVLQTRPPLVTLPVLAALAVLFWTRYRPSSSSARVLPHVLFGFALLCVLWLVIIARYGALNYAVFKVGGWIGPGLLLLGWGVARTLNARARRLAQTGVVFLALARSAALLYGGHEVLGLGRVDLAQQFPREVSPEGRCLVRVDGTDVRRTLASLVGSAAPYYDCTVEAWDAP